MLETLYLLCVLHVSVCNARKLTRNLAQAFESRLSQIMSALCLRPDAFEPTEDATSLRTPSLSLAEPGMWPLDYTLTKRGKVVY